MNEKDVKKLNKTLKSIDKKLEKESSFLYTFVRGLLYGFGFLLGTTIIASAIIAILAEFIDVVPYINSLFGLDPTELSDILESQ